MSLFRKLTAAVPLLGLVLGLMLGAERPASASVLDFEGLDGGATCNAGSLGSATVPVGYGGLNWSAFSIGFGALPVGVECDANYMGAFANSYGAPSSSYAAFNSSSFGEIDAVMPSGTFTFGGVKFSSFAFGDAIPPFGAYSLAIHGYQPGDPNGSPTYSAAFDLLSTGYSSYSTSWTGLDRLAFLAGDLPLSFNGTFGLDGYAFLIDDVVIESVPEPVSVLLLGSGLVAVAVRARKRRQPQPETV